MLIGVLLSTYLHEGPDPPTLLIPLLLRILPSTYFSATPSDNYVEWDSTFNLSSSGIKPATPSDHYVEWDSTFNLSSSRIKSATLLTTLMIGILPSTYLYAGSIPPPPLTTMLRIFMRDQNRNPV